MRGDYMLSAITKAIVAEFQQEPVIAVFTERPTQNAPNEYLFVHQINFEQTPDMGNASNRFYFFDIRYHPDTKTGTEYRTVTRVTERLAECLLYVETDDQLAKASSMRSEIQDGVLHFFVDYPVRVRYQLPEQPKMEDIDIKENVKETP